MDKERGQGKEASGLLIMARANITLPLHTQSLSLSLSVCPAVHFYCAALAINRQIQRATTINSDAAAAFAAVAFFMPYACHWIIGGSSSWLLLLFLPLERNAAGGINPTCSGKESGREIERVRVRLCVSEIPMLCFHMWLVKQPTMPRCRFPAAVVAFADLQSPIPHPPISNLMPKNRCARLPIAFL